MSQPEPTFISSIRAGFAAWTPSAQATTARRRMLTAVYLVAAVSMVSHAVWFFTR